jgi:hypothetical protein
MNSCGRIATLLDGLASSRLGEGGGTRNTPLEENRERPQDFCGVVAVVEYEREDDGWAEEVFDAECVD